jgi:hypothetical protein
MSRGPKLPPPSEATRHLAALLADEAARWPDVTLRPMFGMRALYRGTAIFGLLPDKRSLESPTAIACKLPGSKKQREGEKWRLVELEGQHQVARALVQLEEAYRRAASRKG